MLGAEHLTGLWTDDVCFCATLYILRSHRNHRSFPGALTSLLSELMDAEAFVACFWEVSQKASPASRAGRYCSFADRRKDESPTALTMAAVIMRAHHRQRSPNSAAPTVVARSLARSELRPLRIGKISGMAAPSSYRVDRGRHLASSTFGGVAQCRALSPDFPAGARGLYPLARGCRIRPALGMAPALMVGWIEGGAGFFLFSFPSGLAGPAAHETLPFCGRVVGIEVGIRLARLSPLFSWTRGSWSTSDCRHGPSSVPEHAS